MKCVICNENEATLPDRKSVSRCKKVCRKCHATLLRHDFREIVGRESVKSSPEGKE